MDITRDIVGQRGEWAFATLISKFHPDYGYLFRPNFLGDKWPGVDFIVELMGEGSVTPFFFVQVKTTRQGYTGRENRLRVGVSAASVRVLAAYPAPTYIVGIDEVQEAGYIVSANGERMSALGSLSTAFPMNAADHAARRTLWEEVRAFWNAPASPKLVSAFVDSDWR